MKKSFKDDELFDQITSMTHPEIRVFFKDFVEGGKRLPLKETFDALGINYNPNASRMAAEIKIGFSAGLATDNKHLLITDMSGATSLGKRLGTQPGDVLISMNDEPLTIETYRECFDKYAANTKKGDTVKFVVQRKDASGEAKELALQADIREEPETYLSIEPIAMPTAEQRKFQRAWLTR
jgi:predicted metalloprotease with PDZ domain